MSEQSQIVMDLSLLGRLPTEELEMTTLEVGQPHPLIKPGSPEGITYCYAGGQHHVVLLLHNPQPHETISTGKAAFAFYTEDEVIVLLTRIGTLPWQLATYHSRLQPDTDWLEPALPEPGQSILMHVQMVEVPSYTIRELRVVSPSHDFARALVQAIRMQRLMPWDRARFITRAQRIDDPAVPSAVCITRALHKAQVRWQSRA